MQDINNIKISSGGCIVAVTAFAVLVAPDSLVETLAVFLGATRFLAVTSFGIRGGFEAEGY